jgi:hypothetical protein
MLTERTLWRGATAATIAILVGMILLSRGGQNLDGSASAAVTDIPVHSIVVDDRQRLYLRTHVGVIVSVDGGHTWTTAEAGAQQLFAVAPRRGAWHLALR